MNEEANKFNWDKLSEDMKENVNIELVDEENLVVIHFINEDIIKEETTNDFLFNRNSLIPLIKNYINDMDSKDFEVEINKKKNKITISLNNPDMTKKVYEFFKNFFYGDILKEMLEAIFGSFGNIYGRD